MLQVEGLRFDYDRTPFGFDLDVARGEILGVIGASGSGKSTLLLLIAGFLEPAAGRVRVDGDDITARPPETRPVTTVFQEHNLFPHLTVFDNVALGISPGLSVDGAARESVQAALERVQLSGLARRRPGELSGGQRQRVSLARAMVRARPVLLLDEPLTALGPALRRDLLALIRELVDEQRLAAVLVSHHPDDAAQVAGRTALIHDGRVHRVAPTAELLADRHDTVVRDYLGHTG